MSRIFLVTLGGAFGALARYWIGELVSARWPSVFPLGTFVINITGSFIIGLLLTLLDNHSTIFPDWLDWRLLLMTGFTGAYTTFSTFEYEALQLTQTGKSGLAILYVLTSVVLGFLAVWLGASSARWFS